MGASDTAMPRGRPRLLVCAFGPFPGVAVNPSEALARAMVALRRPALAHTEIRLLVLPTLWASLARLDAALAAFVPDAVLLLGVAARRKRVELELRAVNGAGRAADAAGRHPSRRALAPHGPPELGTTARLAPLHAALRGQNIPARLSRDAGRYLCNAAYFHALAAGQASARHGAAPRVVFIHLPGRSGRPHGVGRCRMVRSLSAVLVALAAQARARVPAEPAAPRSAAPLPAATPRGAGP